MYIYVGIDSMVPLMHVLFGWESILICFVFFRGLDVIGKLCSYYWITIRAVLSSLFQVICHILFPVTDACILQIDR